jgi:hypothetical protein
VFSGPPLPLSSDLPLQWLLRQVRPRAVLGAWVRQSTNKLQIHCRTASRILVSADLGLLLRRCSRVAIREGTQPVVLQAELLIQWRVLQVVTATPYLPGLERLSDIFRTAHLDPTGFQIPIPTRTPEEVLGECLAYGIPVAGTRIVYARAGATASSSTDPSG